VPPTTLRLPRLLPIIASACAGGLSLSLGTLLGQGMSTFRAVALAVGLLLLPVATLHPELLGALFLSMLWGRVSDVGIAEQGLPSLAVPVAVALVGISIARRLVAGERISPTTFHAVFPLLPYFAVVSLSAVWATAPERAMTAAVDLAKNLLIFWVLVELVSSLSALTACCIALVLVAGALGSLGLYQYMTATFASDYGGFAQATVREIVNGVHMYRLAGPIGDPNFYALILLVTVPIGLTLLRTPLHPFVRLAVAVSIVTTGATVLLTYSRGGVLVLALGCLLSLIRFRGHMPWLVPVVLALPIAIALVPGSVLERMGTVLRPFQDTGEVGQVVDTSVELRLGAQRVAVEMFLDHPFGGVGSGNYPLLYQDYSQRLGVTAVASEFPAHNLYLEVAAETGSLGLLAFLPAVIGPLIALERIRRGADRGLRPTRASIELTVGIEIALACYLLASLMLQGSYSRYLWLLVALAVAARRVAPAHPPRR
jgi:putative inorganic carbon (hco3(-)) transporter